MAALMDWEAHFKSRAADYGVPDEFMENLRRRGAPLPMGPAPPLRRLHFESEVVITASVRSTVETSDVTPKPVPLAEKNARWEQLRAKFLGLSVRGSGEAPHCLLDECSAHFETRVLKYIESARCTSRENEIMAGKSDKKLKLDAGSLSIKETKTFFCSLRCTA